MAITNASRLADFGSGIGTAGAVLQIDNANDRIGIGTTNPSNTLQVGIGITMNGVTGVNTASCYPPSNPGDAPEITDAQKTARKSYVWNETDYNADPSTAWNLITS